jgi:hypothetical protein
MLRLSNGAHSRAVVGNVVVSRTYRQKAFDAVLARISHGPVRNAG